MKNLFVLALVIVMSPQLGCKKAETKEPDGKDFSEAEQLAMLDRAVECYEGGAPEGLMVQVIQGSTGEIEGVKITPPADEATTACVIAKVKAPR